MPHLPVAVCNPVPTYVHGLLVILSEAGFAPEELEDLDTWLVAGGRRVVLAPLTEVERLADLCAGNPDVAVVALLEDGSFDSYRTALRRGASGAVPWDATPARVVQVVRAAFDGQSLFPTPIARALASNASIGGVPLLGPVETDWLQKLARGATVAELAAEVGCPTREMFRLLRSLYSRMGVANRREALTKAARSGLLE